MKMTKAILLTAFLISGFILQAQSILYVDGKVVSTEKVKLIKLTCHLNYGTKPAVKLDYGQETKINFTQGKITNSGGSAIEFNSTMDAVNFVVSLGWKYNTYSQTYFATGEAYECFIFSSPKADDFK